MNTIAETKPTGTPPAVSLPDRSPTTAAAAMPGPDVRTTIPYVAVRPDPEQPRKEFPKEAQDELRASIKVNGIHDALIVRADPDPKAKTKYMLVEGERRWRVAGELKLETLPVIVRVFKDDEAVRQYQRIVGTARLNLSLLEQARDYAAELERRRKTHAKFSPEDLADKLGVSRATMYDRLKLTRLTAPVEKALREGAISSAHAVELCKVPTQVLQEELLESIVDDGMSVRDLAESIKDDYLKQLNGVGWDLQNEYAPTLDQKKAAEALPTFGKKSGRLQSCEGCPHRTGNMLAQFPELKDRPNVCTLVDCFKVKSDIGAGLVLAKAKADGFEVVDVKVYNDRYYNFTDASEKCWQDKNQRTFGQLAAVAGKKPKVTIDREGKVVKVFANCELDAVKKGAGVKSQSYSNGVDSAAVNRYKKEKKAFTEKANRATTVILSKLVTKLPDGTVVVPAKLWALLGAAAYRFTDISKHDYVAKRRGLSKSINESRDALTKLLRGMNEPVEQARFIVDVMLCGDWESGGYQKCGWNPKFVELCAIAGGTPDKLAGIRAHQEELPAVKKPVPPAIAKVAAKAGK